MIKVNVYTHRTVDGTYKRFEEDIELQVCPRVDEVIYNAAGQSILRVQEILHDAKDGSTRIRCQ